MQMITRIVHKVNLNCALHTVRVYRPTSHPLPSGGKGVGVYVYLIPVFNKLFQITVTLTNFVM